MPSLTTDGLGWQLPGEWSVMQRKLSSGGLTIVFSKLVTMIGNRGGLLKMVFENCNPLIYCAAMITI
ncbi:MULTISPECIES: hypothetical protein [Acidithiobacillus]|uniref:Uncharacterized protein n=2 Tax=Acidithiobacillus TaxID=119977 RepID=A0A179BJE9_ACIFR|nr:MULTISPECIES: hypothetical protein [Acidithiobacillus]MBU2853501.1 hypothetical protein [Acidithiobacillus ferriphilus]MEB8485565.1 hypothetical protein [Acidithiobacillus ferriphilus]MEB8490153.1 hypothetical protein [Acidithiobacillus ferriphilus]MEB8493484.1 hypothetical protein [Acidithiobacillus ferriphilus]MEB8515221.1 hypothetical protein [Acidithiobacillus ferriphilus]